MSTASTDKTLRIIISDDDQKELFRGPEKIKASLLLWFEASVQDGITYDQHFEFRFTDPEVFWPHAYEIMSVLTKLDDEFTLLDLTTKDNETTITIGTHPWA